MLFFVAYNCIFTSTYCQIGYQETAMLHLPVM